MGHFLVGFRGVAREALGELRAEWYLWFGFAGLWVWQWMLLRPAAIYVSEAGCLLVGSPLQRAYVLTFLGSALVSAAVAIAFRIKGFAPPLRWVRLVSLLLLLCGTLCWLGSCSDFFANPTVGLIPFVICASGGQALLFVCWGLVFSSRPTRTLALHGSLATAVAACLCGAFGESPFSIASVLLIASIGISAAGLYGASWAAKESRSADCSSLLSVDEKAFAGQRCFFPPKLVSSLLVGGLCFGMYNGLTTIQTDGTAVGPLYYFAIVVSSFAAVFCVLLLRLDFNTLLYKVGFIAIALGYFAMAIPFVPMQAGSAVAIFGLRYTDLLIWVLCIHLVRSWGLAPVWSIGLMGCFWMGGRFVGVVSVSLGATMVPDVVEVLRVATAVGMILPLASALFLTSQNNTKEGWGIQRVGEAPDDVERIGNLLSLRFGLSTREKEILLLLIRGCSQKEVAAQLFLSVNTVKTHVKHLYGKLGIHSYKELVALRNDFSVPKPHDS